jgi:diguanylate cyclase (GGDEF)-like protein
MVVNDTRLDPRFLDNPLVTGDPRIRFYAGAPLVTPDGQALGTLCVIDSAPREMSVQKLDALRALSRLATAQLELRRVVGEVDSNAAELRARLLQFEEQQSLLEAANAGLKSLSITDSLTGVKNRRAFDQGLHQELARASREGTPVSLLLIDIDKFKSYNDNFGHPAGDEAIRRVAQTLAARARPFDMVARYGGEEFAVILPNTTAYRAAMVGERLRRAVEDVSWTHSGITISVGVSTAESGQDGAAMTTRADRALYWVKQAGGNQVAHANRFQKEMEQAALPDRSRE